MIVFVYFSFVINIFNSGTPELLQRQRLLDKHMGGRRLDAESGLRQSLGALAQLIILILHLNRCFCFYVRIIILIHN